VLEVNFELTTFKSFTGDATFGFEEKKVTISENFVCNEE